MARPKPRSPLKPPRLKPRSLLLKLRSPLTLLPLRLLPLLRLPLPLLLALLRLPLLPLLLLPLLLLPLRPLPLRPLLRLLLLRLLLRRRSNSSPAFGQEKASLRAGFFYVSAGGGDGIPLWDMSASLARTVSQRSPLYFPGNIRSSPARSEVAPGEAILLGRDADPVRLAIQHRGQCRLCKCGTIVFL